jgi:hypothetical protein
VFVHFSSNHHFTGRGGGDPPCEPGVELTAPRMSRTGKPWFPNPKPIPGPGQVQRPGFGLPDYLRKAPGYFVKSDPSRQGLEERPGVFLRPAPFEGQLFTAWADSGRPTAHTGRAWHRTDRSWHLGASPLVSLSRPRFPGSRSSSTHYSGYDQMGRWWARSD